MSDVKILAGGLAPSPFEGLLGVDQSVLDAMPTAVYVCAADGVVVRYNRRASELWGRSPRPGDSEERFCGAYRLYRLDGQFLAHASTPMETALRTGEFQQVFEGRRAALASAHDLLMRGNWESAFLHEVADEAIRGCGPAKSRVSLGGPPILLQPKQAGSIAMALHELCTNAVKYGALSSGRGRVDFEWRTSDGSEPRLTLAWRESGGPAVSPPRHRGFGSRMIEQALAQDLQGEVTMEFRPEGFVCTIEAPLPEKENTQ